MMRGRLLSSSSSSCLSAAARIQYSTSLKEGKRATAIFVNSKSKQSSILLLLQQQQKQQQQQHSTKHSFVFCSPFSTTSGGGGGKGSKGGKDEEEEDPFGLQYKDDTPNNIGSSIPPSYSRDETTGKFTGEVQSELSSKDEELLNLNAVDAERVLAERFMKSWGDDEDDEDEKLNELAERVREEKIAFSSIGRAPRTSSHHHHDDDDDDESVEEAKADMALSPSEASALREFLKKRYNKDIPTTSSSSNDDDDNEYSMDDDIPIQSIESGPDTSSSSSSSSYTDVDLDLSYLAPSAQKEYTEYTTGLPTEDPFLELMPHDLNPTRKVNRRKAKLVPKQLLHHNNLTLLRRYVTPGGQIMNRVQSRLGAKDQRKVAKMIKRARCLGLIPFMGQWKYEDHGNVSELDVLKYQQKMMMMMMKKKKIQEEEEEGEFSFQDGEDLTMEKEWEKELKRRGLVIEYKPALSPEMVERMLELEKRMLGDGDDDDDGVKDEDIVKTNEGEGKQIKS